MIGIICALDKELQSFLDILENSKETKILNFTIHSGFIKGHECALMKCGMGKMQAAISATLLIEHFQPDLIINSGIAGGYDQKLKTLDTVVSKRVGCYDIDMVFDHLPFGCFDQNERFLECPLNLDNQSNLIKGTIMTADKFVGNREEVDAIFNKHYVNEDITCIDMESYAIALIAHKHNIPWVIFRTISDIIGKENQINDYYQFMALASIQSFNRIMDNFFKEGK